MVKSYEVGGGNAIDFDVTNGVLKLKWLKSFTTNRHSIWFIIPNLIFERMVGIDFPLCCSLEYSTLPAKL